ncbi:protein kinase [Streptomyces sp. NPDC051909]|uniref:protein kinase domain-containing protein n=1 Tax=Streptomyces sp. NPDC051909 TaxID=3154944 RepID=UPI0034271AA8
MTDRNTLAAAGGHSVGAGRYVLSGILGRGGMASVHRAHDTVLERPVAVKILRADLGTDPALRERFRREAQAVAKLNHTNIVSVFDSGEDVVRGAVVPYIVMEYVEGQPLSALIAGEAGRCTAVPVPKALMITKDVLAALKASHEVGLVHRDIKPSNVMMTTRGVVKVMDFGIARTIQSQVAAVTQTGLVVGTPQYLSPEQALGRPVDARADLYSVGCLLFELLTGRTPFEGESALEVVYAHVEQTPHPPSAWNPLVPPVVDELVARALQKKSADRFQTADEMLAAILQASRPRHEDRWPTQPSSPQFPTGSAGSLASAQAAQSLASVPAVHLPPHSVMPPFGAPAASGPAAAPLSWGPSNGTRRFDQTRHQQHRGNGGKTWRRALLWTACVFAVAGTGTLAVLLPAGGEEESDRTNSSRTRTPAASSSNPRPTVVGDPSLKMNPSDCNDSFWPDGRVTVPYFRLNHIDSVQACARTGGWRLILKEQNEVLWGKGIVVRQEPFATQVDPADKVVTVWVSTGHG